MPEMAFSHTTSYLRSERGGALNRNHHVAEVFSRFSEGKVGLHRQKTVNEAPTEQNPAPKEREIPPKDRTNDPERRNEVNSRGENTRYDQTSKETKTEQQRKNSNRNRVK